mmetsp:Transcript_21082/g.39574  ORF Transcript_21082/g.39574 Transcript_21082/m.39574 type:complete len:167 (-) Transcript_21082:160-660(-)
MTLRLIRTRSSIRCSVRGASKGFIGATGPLSRCGDRSARFTSPFTKPSSPLSAFANLSLIIVPSEEVPGLSYFACSATAAGVAAVATNPLDVIRVRRMVDGMGGHHFQYKSLNHAFTHILQKEGVSALWKGLTARVMWYVPVEALGMTFYEKLKHLFGAGKPELGS